MADVVWEEVPTAVKRTGFGDWSVAEHYRAG